MKLDVHGLKWCFAFILGCCWQQVNAQRFLTPVFETVEHTLDISYGNAENYLGVIEDLQVDFYEPQADTMAYRPLVIYVHGGGFVDVTQTKSLVHIVAFCDSLAVRGYTAASINYRLDSTISNRAVINAMQDAKAAVRFFKANFETYKIDTNLIFIGGESAGAITSLNVNYMNLPAETSFPPTLPLALDNSVEGNSGNPGYSSRTKAALCFCGGTQTTAGEWLFDTLSIQSAADQPLLMVHGTADPLISTARALDIAIRATNVGLPNLFYTLPGATHCPWFYPLEDSWTYLDSLIDYTVPFLYACIDETAGLTESEKNELIQIYPNPVLDKAIVSLYTADEQVYYIFDLTGNVVDTGKITGSMEIDLENLENGLYIISFPTLNITQKIIKE